MRYDVRTETTPSGRMVSTIDEVDDLNVRVTLFRHVINFEDAQIKAALRDLGWRAPGEIAAIDIPARPGYYDQMGQKARRITAQDYLNLEARITGLLGKLKRINRIVSTT